MWRFGGSGEGPAVDWRDRIVIDPSILVGKPVVRGTRIAVEFLLELLAEGWTVEQVLTNYPQLSADDVHAVLHYAADSLKQEQFFPLLMSQHGEVPRQ